MSIPMAVLKQSADICVPSLTDLLNNAINDCHWPLELGSAIITPAHESHQRLQKKIIALSVYFHLYLKSLENYHTIN